MRLWPSLVSILSLCAAAPAGAQTVLPSSAPLVAQNPVMPSSAPLITQTVEMIPLDPVTQPDPVKTPWEKGAEIQLMVIREVNSRTAKPGDRFVLRVNAPVEVDGQVAIAVGASATGEVVSVNGTRAVGGSGRLTVRLLSVETRWGPIRLSGSRRTEGDSNAGGVIMGVLGFGIFGLLNKGGNASLKGGDLITGFLE